eukprot:2319429-Pyramimonas_sp.AAC.1
MCAPCCGHPARAQHCHGGKWRRNAQDGVHMLTKSSPPRVEGGREFGAAREPHTTSRWRAGWPWQGRLRHTSYP